MLAVASVAASSFVPGTAGVAAGRARSQPHASMLLGSDAGPARSALSAMLAASLLLSPVQLPLMPTALHTVANAKELASGSGSKVNKDPNSLLRLGLPGQPKEVRELQADLEEVADSLSRLLTINANSAVGKVKGVLKSKTAAIVKATPAAGADRATQLLDAISEDVTKLAGLIGENQLGDANVVTEAALTKVSALEELIATGYTQPTPPGEFKGLPYLKGRAVVQWEVKRPGEKFDVDGARRPTPSPRPAPPRDDPLPVPGPRSAPRAAVPPPSVAWHGADLCARPLPAGALYDKLVMKTVVDGFTAPITSGNFVDLVNKGFYNGIHVQRSDGFVVQTGDPSQEPKAENKEIHGFVPAGDSKVRKIPLEVFVRGDKAPIYGT